MCIHKPRALRDPPPSPTDRIARSKEARSVFHRRPRRDSTTDICDTAVAHFKRWGGILAHKNVAIPPCFRAHKRIAQSAHGNSARIFPNSHPPPPRQPHPKNARHPQPTATALLG